MAAQDQYKHYDDSINRAVQNVMASSRTAANVPNGNASGTSTVVWTNGGGVAAVGQLPLNLSKPVPAPANVLVSNSASNGNMSSTPGVIFNTQAPPPLHSANFRGYIYPYPLPNTSIPIPSFQTQTFRFPTVGFTSTQPSSSTTNAFTLVPSTKGTSIRIRKVKTKKMVASSTYVPSLPDAQSAPQAPKFSFTQSEYEVKANPAVPPNWDASYNQAIQVIAPYNSTPVSNTSFEYQALAKLVEPQLAIKAINRIVNPELWRKFSQTRKDLMSRKVEELELLGELGLPEDELLHRVHVNTNFDKSPSLITDYSDNVALLFHGTRGDMEAILCQGLDERLGNAAGTSLLGRGIYFADDPMKSVQYDRNSTLIVFMVLLGDCLSTDNLPNRNSFVREPAKTKEQQRNHTDLFFDSITGRPASVNEYVIYNRYHCCPVYTISYAFASTTATSEFTPSRNSQPPFAWLPGQGNGVAMPPRGTVSWPFFAQTIFAQMQGDEVKVNMGAVNDKEKPVDSGSNSEKDKQKEEEEESLAVKLSMLTELGFSDDTLNMECLKKFDYDVEKAIDELIQNKFTTVDNTSSAKTEPKNSATASSSSAAIVKKMKMDKPSSSSDSDSTENRGRVTRSKAKRKAEPSATVTSTTTANQNVIDEEEECVICCAAYPTTAKHWRELKCGHKLCVPCHTNLETSGTTMSGVKHTFLKCPFCKAVTGVEIGTCPTGTITINELKGTFTPGNGNYSTYSIQYYVPGPAGLNRVAYVPGSPEGLKVINLLKIAWDRRLCFVIGTSATTGAQNVLVWNIHHKTALTGGVQCYGYPDPTYLDRVQEELAAVGVV